MTACCRSHGPTSLAQGQLVPLCLLKLKRMTFVGDTLLLCCMACLAFCPCQSPPKQIWACFTPSLVKCDGVARSQPQQQGCFVRAYQFQQPGSCVLRSKAQCQRVVNMLTYVYTHSALYYDWKVCGSSYPLELVFWHSG